MHSFIGKETVDISGSGAITALIDADSISYIVGYDNGPESEPEAVMSTVDQMISMMLVTVQARQFSGWLSPKKTWRHALYPEYKSKRKDPHPNIALWLPYIKLHMRDEWGFREWPEHEADDAVSSLQSIMSNTIICSPDKDMKGIPGNHYDYKKGIKFYVTPEEANYHYHYQMLMGDGGDNIKGCPGVGKVGAKQVLDEALKMGMELRDAVNRTYAHKCGAEWEQEVALNSVLLRLRQVDNLRTEELELLYSNIHSFDLDAAGTSSYIVPSARMNDATDLFGDW